ncbi:MAG TPA: hypothetical protein VL947_12895 [Cytophagales bacterium]|nr:hypothetical protein [Cytophagales bacterium]
MSDKRATSEVLEEKSSGKATERSGHREWKSYEKILFRIAFVFFVIMVVPADPKFYALPFTIDWTNLHYRDIYDMCYVRTYNFVEPSPEGRWGIGGFINLGVVLLIAIAGGIVWTLLDRKRKEYDVLYYWLRVLVRYRAALGIIGFGFTKLLPVQMPYPSLSLLNTDFGDFSGQKIYWMSIGSVPWYQVFAGVVEIGAGIMLFFRRTTAWGAALLLGALATIAVVNLGYDGGVHVYASYFVILSGFILAIDVRPIYKLLILEQVTAPAYHWYPVFSAWQQYARAGIKVAILGIFVGLFFYLQFINFLYDPYKQPSTKGLAQLRGNYNVTEFRLNNKVLPYDPTDPVRWQEVTFEKWTTMTYKVNKPVQLDLSNGGGDPMKDINRTFEVSGVAGGKRVFFYNVDTVDKVLYLQDKNQPTKPRNVGPGGSRNEAKKKEEDKDSIYPANWIPDYAKARFGDPVTKIHPKAVNTRRIKAYTEEPEIKSRRKMILKYETSDGSRVVLSGTDENRDSIYVVLDKVQRSYNLSEGKLKPGQYD